MGNKVTSQSKYYFKFCYFGRSQGSSEIENIVKTFDEIFKEITLKTNNPALKKSSTIDRQSLKDVKW
jgi:hypothetical protein